MTSATIDHNDRALIRALRTKPRASVVELSRLAGLARNTVQSRLQRMEERGVISGYGPDIGPRAAGYDVMAFTTLTLDQGSVESSAAFLESVPEVLEIHTVTGHGDLLIKVVARSNDHLHDVLQKIASQAAVVRSDTQLALHTGLNRTIADLVIADKSV